MGQAGSTVVKSLIPCIPRTESPSRPASPNPIQRPAPPALGYELNDLRSMQTNRRNQTSASDSQVNAPAPKRRPSVGSIVDGDRYYTTGPIQTSIEAMAAKPSLLRQHEVVLGRDGKLYEGNQILHGENKKYVMDGKGKIYSDVNSKLIYHTDFLASGRAAAAGEISANNGYISEINNKSGHYQPNTKHTDQVIQELEKRGLNMAKVGRNEIPTINKNIRNYKDEDGDWVMIEKEH